MLARSLFSQNYGRGQPTQKSVSSPARLAKAGKIDDEPFLYIPKMPYRISKCGRV
jgi:hypothetical protein